METKYFEAYNQDNVELIDINENTIERITTTGILTQEKDFEFDFIIYATGFDPILGSYDRINIEGTNGEKLRDQWKQELSSFLGIQVNNFPNLFMILGPHGVLGNLPRSIEYNVEWITTLIDFMRERGLTRAEATPEAVDSWYNYVLEKGEGRLSNQVDSWFTGVNSNLEGRQKRILATYSGSQVSFRERCDEVASNSYAELNLL